MTTNHKQLSSTHLRPLASPPSPRVISVRSMQQLLNQIEQVKFEVQTRVRTLKKIDTGQRKTMTYRDHSIEGRRQIKNLIDHIMNLQKQMNIMTKESDPNWPTKTFDKSKQKALKPLSKLLNQLNEVEQHLEKVIGAISPATYTTEQAISTEGGNTRKIVSSVTDRRRTPSLSESEEETTSDEDEEDSDTEEEEDEYVRTVGKQEPPNSSRLTTKADIASNESDNYQSDSPDTDRQFHTSIPSYINRKPTIVSTSTPLSHQKTPSPQPAIIIPMAKTDDGSEDVSYFEEEEDKELTRLRDSSEHDETEDNQSTDVNPYVEELRMGKYFSGTPFLVTHHLKGLQTGDLTIHKDEIIILLEQKSDDWWLFKNPQTHEQGLVPINHIRLHSKTSHPRLSHRLKPVASSSTLVDVFRTNKYIPSGFIASDLAPLTNQNRYKLSRILIPKMTESNFAFTDLHWRYDVERIHIQQVKYQKILTIKKCLRIPKIQGEQIRVLNRCLRVCLYDGLEIISNIHSTRAETSDQINSHHLTENWHFAKINKNTFTDEQSRFLIRSNEYKQLYILIELSQLCQSKINQEKCEIGCGWILIPLDEHNQSKSSNQLLQGGHFSQTNILLHSEYQHLHSNGLFGKIDRYKKARIQFSIESRETHPDLLYDQLPLTSMIIPINLIRILVFYRNELAYQLEKHSQSHRLSTKPIDSIFLSTFYQTLEQPDLIYVLQDLSHQFRKFNNRDEFLRIYESSIYPLLFYRSLPPYNFHNIFIINHRKKLISAMISKQLTKQKNQQDILKILLDPNLTDQWSPFTTDEICFSLQKYARD